MSRIHSDESAIGCDVVVTRHGDSVVFRNYLVERPTQSPALRAVEAILDVTLTLPHPVAKVWPIFKNFNLWMNRFGYFWDRVPADSENAFACLRNKGATELKYGSDGVGFNYLVRKVVEEQLIYFESLPQRLVDKDGYWSAHDVVSLRETNGHTEISFFMEHTWYSETMPVDEIRAEARGIMFDVALAFWRDYFIPDLVSLVNTGRVAIQK